MSSVYGVGRINKHTNISVAWNRNKFRSITYKQETISPVVTIYHTYTNHQLLQIIFRRRRSTSTFTSPIAVSQGQILNIGLSWLNGDADCTSNCAVIWLGSEGDPYPEGEVMRTFDSGASWQKSDYNDDLWFRVWAGQHSCENYSCVAEQE